MGVLRPIKDDEEYGGVGKPADQVVEELLGGLVDPVEVLDDNDEGMGLALPDEEVS